MFNPTNAHRQLLGYQTKEIIRTLFIKEERYRHQYTSETVYNVHHSCVILKAKILTKIIQLLSKPLNHFNCTPNVCEQHHGVLVPCENTS